MSTKTKILIAEHDPVDLELLLNELKKSEINFDSRVVDNGEDYGLALKNFVPDIILSDYTFPAFDGPAAFKMRQEIAPEIPFIFVTGTLGEEVSVDFIKNGVTDYVLKDRLFTLNSKIKRGLKESSEKQKKNKTEEELIKNENRFRALIEHSADMKTLSTPEGTLLYGSPSITRILGYSINDYLSMNVYDLIHSDDVLDPEEAMEMLKTPGKSLNVQQRLRHRNGKWIWCEGTITNMLHESGINALVSNFRDISEKKMTEKQREFESNNLDALINNTKDLMWSVDRNFNLITSNQPFDEMSKINFGKTIDKGENVLSAAYNPEMLSNFKKLYERAFAGEAFSEISYFDFPSELWTEISYYPIRKKDIIIGTACHSRDITNIKKAEKQLSKSEIRLKEAQSIAHISNWEIDLLTHTHTWSDEFYKIYGINKSDVEPSAEAFLSFIHPEDAIYAQKKIQEAFETLKASSMNFRFISEDGSIKYGYTEWRFEFDKNNNPIRLYGILQDRTEQKSAELILKESEARLAEAQAIAHFSNWEIDLVHNIVNWSDELYKIFRINKEEVKPSTELFFSFIHTDDVTKLRQTVQDTLDSLKDSSSNFRFIRKDGSLGYGYIERKLELNNDNKPVRLYGIFQDITEQKKAELIITESEARLAEAQALAKVGNWETNLVTMKVIWSAETFRIFALNPGEFQPLHPAFMELVHPDDRQKVQAAFTRSYTNNLINSIEHRVLTSTGLVKIVEERWMVEHDKNGLPCLAVGTCQDISERKKTEEERLKLSEDLIQRNRDLEQFTFIISHNLRAPTANIIGFTEYLQDETLTQKEQKEFLKGLAISVSGLDTIIKDINSILQVKSEFKESKEVISFTKLANDIFISLGNLIDKNHVRIKLDFSEIDEIISLKVYMYSIFYNLISNSIKYRKVDESPLIEIKSKIVDKNIELTFKDNGLGIDLKTKGDKVFGLYKRFHTHVEGKGMGLFMVKTQVEALGGKISVVSELNKGTQFTIAFET